ncbi:MAG: methylated-DNA--[protein]-cysteine S-methyltransferase [Phycisphaerae bacterium]|nr:methylated-DNA--[protein]-cysteine S-methyltransferase [Phycisphaerae bacterium]
MRYVIFETKFGFCGILASKGGILRTSLPVSDRKSAEMDLLAGLEGAEFAPNLLVNLQNQIKSYFSGTYVEFDSEIPLLIDELSKFSQEILKACRKIPYGQIVSYAELAKMANHPKAARAVGNAMGNNPIPLIIPCHRVVKSDGTTGGFQRNRPGGAGLKKRMLDVEKCTKSSPFSTGIKS